MDRERSAEVNRERRVKRGIILVNTFFVVIVFVGLAVAAYLLPGTVREWIDDLIVAPAIDYVQDLLSNE